MLEMREFTKKGEYFVSCFVVSLRGRVGVHDGYSRIEASHWERNQGTSGSCGNTSDGYIKGGGY